jgi:HlyD family secretion protein
MKRWIIGSVIVVLLVGGFVYLVRTGAFNLEFAPLKGETKAAVRKRLSIPIRASGLIEPASLPIEIKSKANGEVKKIYVRAGDLVKQGDLLLELDPKDEERRRDQARAEMLSKKAVWEKAQYALTQEEANYEPNVKAAEAAVASAQALVVRLEWEWKKIDDSFAKGAATPQEHATMKASFDGAQADLRRMQAELERVRNSKTLQDIAREDVALAHEAFQAATKAYEDAEQRLRETKIYAPIDGMIAKINVRVGEMIQSGTTSLTGGTLLMAIADISDLYMTAQVDEADISTVLDLSPPQARPGMQRVAAMMADSSASAAQSDTPQADPAKPALAVATQPPEALRQGRPVKISVEAFREETFEGVIEHVAPEPLRQQSVVTYDVRIKLTSPNRYKLLLGMQADAEFTLEAVDAIVIPVDAVRILDGDTERGSKGERGVWVPVKNGGGISPKKQWRTCRFGLDDGAEIEVISGLKEGEEVFTKLPVVLDKDKDKGSENESAAG